MNFKKIKRQQGFTLVELMIVVAIIAIITSIAYPSYRENVIRSNRAEAKAGLLENAQYMERFFTENNSYEKSLSGTEPKLPRERTPYSEADDTKIKYKIEIKDKTQTTFTLQAVRENSMSEDACKTFTINGLGQKKIDGTPDTPMTEETCWSK